MGSVKNKSFIEVVAPGPVVLRYPVDFGVKRPLPSGMHTVVWSLDWQEADRTAFVVRDDREELAELLKELQEYRGIGQRLLDDLPGDDFVEWDKRAKVWAAMLEVIFSRSPHLGPSAAEQLAVWGGESRERPQDSAAAAITHRLERIDWYIERFDA